MKNILFLFGGQSNEHTVSIQSAYSVLQNIPKSYSVIPVYISTDGYWYKSNSNLSINYDVSHFNIPTELTYTEGRVLLDGETIDILFPLIHGQNGEDGTIQGFARIYNLPIVGPDFNTAFITYDKDITKNLLEKAGIQTAPYVTINSNMIPVFESISYQLGLPFFIKPARSGSSVGVSKVAHKEQFLPAVELALNEDSKVLIEQGMVGREIEIAVFIKKNGDRIISSSIAEVKPDTDKFYSFDEKYLSGSSTQVNSNASFSDIEKGEIYNTVNQVLDVLDLRGTARIDCFLLADGRVILNEINTIPGFTAISMYPKLFENSGISFSELLTLMIEESS
jgi:D-alanine-D-alanine ligase